MADLTLVETEDVADITPDHSTVALAKEMAKDAPEAVAGFYVLIDQNDDLIYDMAGMRPKDILWALVKMQKRLLEGEFDD